MGFVFHAIKLPKVTPIYFFLYMIYHAPSLFLGALIHLGLYKPPPQEPPEPAATPDDYILILDSSYPSLVPVPVRVAIAAIKNRVPIIQYKEFLRRRREREGGGEKLCCVCLECIEGRHEIRELCNCRHLFHRECLDRWIDEGQVSCPLCRSILLPPKLNLFRCNEFRDDAHSLHSSS